MCKRENAQRFKLVGSNYEYFQRTYIYDVIMFTNTPYDENTAEEFVSISNMQISKMHIYDGRT